MRFLRRITFPCLKHNKHGGAILCCENTKIDILRSASPARFLPEPQALYFYIIILNWGMGNEQLVCSISLLSLMWYSIALLFFWYVWSPLIKDPLSTGEASIMRLPFESTLEACLSVFRHLSTINAKMAEVVQSFYLLWLDPTVDKSKNRVAHWQLWLLVR